MSTRENPSSRDGGVDASVPTLGSALEGVVAEVGRLVGSFDPAVITATDAAELVGRFAELERLAAAGRLLAAGRMARTSVWAGDGDRDVAEWMARTTGQSRSDARKDLAAARVLDDLDDTRDALRQGWLTKEQVREIAPAAAAAPGAEGGLLSEAVNGSVEQLATKARAAKAAARGDGREAVERVRRRRCITHGRGAAWLRASGTPDDIAKILAGIVPWAEQARRAARADGDVLTTDQASFDGLVAIAAQPVPRTGTGKRNGERSPRNGNDERGSADARGIGTAGAGSGDVLVGWADDSDAPDDTDSPAPGDGSTHVTGPSDGLSAGPGSPRWAAKVIVNIDLAALRRGYTVGGERCEITGIGPVPVATVDDLLARDDTFLAAVVREGTDIAKVAHLGRAPTAAQRTALESDHATCCIDGCPDPPKVIDHHHRFADDGPRTLANLGPLCDDHDHRKTHDHWVLVRHGRSRRLVPPHHPDAHGATPGGSIDLDAPPSDEGPADRSERRGRPPGAGEPGSRDRGATKDATQLDLLAG